MTQIKHSRRLQTGLAGLSVFSAIGAALGLGLTTHTADAATAIHTNGRAPGSARDRTSTSTPTGPVTSPGASAAQATTSGS